MKPIFYVEKYLAYIDLYEQEFVAPFSSRRRDGDEV